jgi:hypothetical protein
VLLLRTRQKIIGAILEYFKVDEHNESFMKTYAMKDWLWPKSYARDILMGALGVFSGDMNEILKRLALN